MALRRPIYQRNNIRRPASVMPRKTETHWLAFVIVINILVCIVLSSLLHAGSQAIVD